jgi:hypothetical protein
VIAKKAHDLQGIDGYISSDCFLAPQVLANGQLILAATTITWDDAVCKDGKIVNFSEEIFQIESGTPAYDEFIEKLRKA